MTHGPWRVLAFTIVISGLAAPPAAGQTQHRDPSSAVRAGDRVIITANNTRIPGRVTAVSASIITLAAKASLFEGADPRAGTIGLSVPVNRIEQIQRADSLWNGFLLGFAAGAVPGAIVGQVSCGEGPTGTCARGATIGIMLFGGLGGAIGAGIDEALKKTIYRRAAGTVTVGAHQGAFGVRLRF